jgi:hypothetical protein
MRAYQLSPPPLAMRRICEATRLLNPERYRRLERANHLLSPLGQTCAAGIGFGREWLGLGFS